MAEEDWITVSEAVAVTGFHRVHIHWLIKNEKITGRRSGWYYLVDRNSLLAYQRQMEELGKKKHGLRYE